jgi:geranylgeranyl diphosphate synthase type II
MLLEKRQQTESSLSYYFSKLTFPPGAGSALLKKSVEYSLLSEGKRFRPSLCVLIAEAFSQDPAVVLPWACAIEMIHTYSLIHDDLPCMDNDDFRRGKPTNHKVFPESTALLAGDALLTEAFSLLATEYAHKSHLGLRLVGLLAQAAGCQGMVGGQALDLSAKADLQTKEELLLMHRLKTGALIRVCCEGAAVICERTSQEVELCRKFGEDLGLAFQLADDILDSQDSKLEKGSLPASIGLEQTKLDLLQVSEQAQSRLRDLAFKSGSLRKLVEYNLQRKS